MPKRHLRLAAGLALAVAWLGFVIQGSHALLSDTAVLTGNSIASGNVDLQVSNSQNGSSTLFADSRAGFSETLLPGQSGDNYLFLKNATASDVPLDIDMSVSGLQDGGQGLASKATLALTPVDASGLSTGPPVTADIAALASGHMPLGMTIASQKAQRFRLSAALSASAGQQGASLSYDLVFTGTQHIAQ